MNRNQKGFTLVELLAVIVILAIILAIAVPSISGITSSARRGAFESDAKMLVSGLGYQQTQGMMGQGSFEVEDDTTLSTENITAIGGNPDNYTTVRVINLNPITICVHTTSTSKFGEHKAKATTTTVTDFTGDCTTATN